MLRRRRQLYFDLCRPDLERLHAEQLRDDARQAAYQQWRAAQATKSPAEQAAAKQRKQEFYRKNYWLITERMVGSLEPMQHIDGCPKAARLFFEKPYANLERDCFNCKAFRGYSPDHSAIVCLYEYLKRKGDIR